MTSEGIVTKLLPAGMAEVAVTRGTACGGNCPSCESCKFQSEMKTAAKNRIGARPGNKVVIESRTSVIVHAVLLVYIMPLIFFIAGYAAAHMLGAAEGVCIAVSFAMLVVSAVILVLTQRSKKRTQIEFDIVSICEGEDND